MKRKAILVVSLLLAVGMLPLSGCNSDKPQKEGEATTLTWYVPGDAQSDAASVMEQVNAYLTEKLGVTLEISRVDVGAFEERMRMKMAAGEAFDLAFTGYCNPYNAAVKNGGLYPLGKLMEQHAPKLKSAVSDYLWQAVAVDGEIYAVPNEQTMAARFGLFLKKDLVKKYNYDVSQIKTMDDIESFFELVKKNDPDLYPFQTKAGPWMWTYGTYEELISGVDLAIRNDDETLQVVDLYETPEYLHGLQKLREWFEKGYIRQDIASMTSDTTEVSAGKYAVTTTTAKPGSEAEMYQRNGYEVEMVEIFPPYLTTEATKATMNAIGAKSKNPEKAIRFLELLNTDKEFYNLICFGIEGKHYEKTADGHVRLIENSGYNEGASAWKFGNQFNAMLLDGQASDLWELTKKQNDDSIKSPALGFVFDTDPVVNNMSQIATVTQKYKVRNTGAEDPSVYWNAYMNDLKAAGREQVKEELQRQLDEFKKTK